MVTGRPTTDIRRLATDDERPMTNENMPGAANRQQQAKLSIQNLFFTYPDGTEALRNINLDIFAHELFVLFGPARSGKTTLLRLLNRLSDLIENGRRQGTILFNQQNIFQPGTDVTELRRQISMVFAIPTPLPGTIYENLVYGLRMAGTRDTRLLDERVERSLQQAALWDEVKDRLHTSAYALSGGQKQRMCLARSLVLEPDVILLDNPTSGLDPISTATVESSLYEIKQRYTIIMVPHSVQQAARVADRAAFLLDGELVEVGLQGEMFLNPQDKRTEDYITGRFG
jgi:phosphate transport system ATP-binding protein